MEIKKVGVIGAGTMGIGLTVELVLHKIDCVLIDISEDILKKAEKEIVKGVRFAPLAKKTARKISADEIKERVKYSVNFEDLADCDFIIENVTEDIPIKEDVYRKIDKICKEDVCFVVNTSCISITKIGSFTRRSDKIIGMHFMNPVFLKPVVEVIKGYHTSEKTIKIAEEFLSKVEKEGIIVNDFPGFVSNRISHLFMNEAMYTLQDGVATARQIDDIFKKCFGHTMGPLETADLIGLDTVMNSLDVLYDSYHDPKFRCCPLLRKMVDAGNLGKKSGKGFYDYVM